ncbi:MAG: Gx transporter family protein [Firmicutes bacterium]|nr:Gx transporter family protein [Bacillota bacterium]
MGKTKKMVMLAIFTAQAIVLSIIENWIPLPIALPGIKLGLANIIVLTTIVFLGLKDAFILVILRTVISSLFTGGFTVFLFSIAGGILSTVVMNFMYYKTTGLFSIIGISIAGAVMHNIGQLLMAGVIMKDFSVMAYLPILILSGVIMGSFVGLCSNYLIKALKRTNIFQKILVR